MKLWLSHTGDTMVFLDTNFLIGFLRDNEQAIARMEKLRQSNLPLRTTVINACELYSGAFASTKKQGDVKKVDELLACMEIASPDLQAAKTHGEIYSELRKKGSLLPDFDIFIIRHKSTYINIFHVRLFTARH